MDNNYGRTYENTKYDKVMKEINSAQDMIDSAAHPPNSEMLPKALKIGDCTSDAAASHSPMMH